MTGLARSVEEDRDTVRLLGESGHLEPGLAKRLIPMAGLRNILVHDYVDVDHSQLYALLRDNLEEWNRICLD